MAEELDNVVDPARASQLLEYVAPRSVAHDLVSKIRTALRELGGGGNQGLVILLGTQIRDSNHASHVGAVPLFSGYSPTSTPSGMMLTRLDGTPSVREHRRPLQGVRDDSSGEWIRQPFARGSRRSVLYRFRSHQLPIRPERFRRPRRPAGRRYSNRESKVWRTGMRSRRPPLRRTPRLPSPSHGLSGPGMRGLDYRDAAPTCPPPADRAPLLSQAHDMDANNNGH